MVHEKGTDMNPYRKKLIGVALSLDAINNASAREKSIPEGVPSREMGPGPNGATAVWLPKHRFVRNRNGIGAAPSPKRRV